MWMKILATSFAVLGTVIVCMPLVAQTAAQTPAAAPTPRPPAPAYDGWTGKELPLGKPAEQTPAPKRDLTGIWNPMNGVGDGIGVLGAKNMPDDKKPEHNLPYTPEGLAAFNTHHPGVGTRMAEPLEIDDPVNFCEPQGMPRENLFELRTTQFMQDAKKIVILYEFNKVWREVWTDGRELPKDPEPQWYGYSIGKWVDDYTFVVDTIGTDQRSWVDVAGRPHSDETHIEERFHRVSKEVLEITMTIDDRKFYSAPWVALDKFPMRLSRDDFHAREMICSPSEYQRYLQTFAPGTK
jgi:hypothetical protein